jgi:hypothetical protein
MREIGEMRSFLFLAAAPIALVFACGAQLCVEEGWRGIPPCPPGDVVYPAQSLGFSTDAADCPLQDVSEPPNLAISSSATDPSQNVGPIPADGRVYVWDYWGTLRPEPVGARTGYGYDGFWVRFAGEIPVAGYDPIADVDQTWDRSTSTLSVAQDCELKNAPALIGALLVLPISVEPTSWGRVKTSYR